LPCSILLAQLPELRELRIPCRPRALRAVEDPAIRRQLLDARIVEAGRAQPGNDLTQRSVESGRAAHTMVQRQRLDHAVRALAGQLLRKGGRHVRSQQRRLLPGMPGNGGRGKEDGSEKCHDARAASKAVRARRAQEAGRGRGRDPRGGVLTTHARRAQGCGAVINERQRHKKARVDRNRGPGHPARRQNARNGGLGEAAPSTR
jgi:hypothetical protein